METARKDKRIYTKRSKEERNTLLRARIETLKAFHAKQAARITTLEAKLLNV